MPDSPANWTREELLTYLLLYCAHADMEEEEVELELIRSKVGEAIFHRVHAEFEQDNDYQSINKIMEAVDRLFPGTSAKKLLQMEMKDLFFSDGKFDIMERNLMRGMERLFK